MKDWSGWGGKDVQRLLGGLESRGAVIPATIPGLGDGLLRVEDADLSTEPAPPTVFMLHKADPLVRAHASGLKEQFPGVEVLQYLLIDGAFQGAVLGHWRIGPHDVEDIAVTLPPAERTTRQDEIIRAVAWGYQPPFSHIRQYAGAGVEGSTFALSREQGKTNS
ncbi:MAG: hypothetical protein ACYC7E_02855 [Armatimonadota bacterium]